MDILIRQGTVRFPRMMATAALVSLVLAVLVYVPGGPVARQDGGADRVSTTTPPRSSGSTWCSSTAGPIALTAPRRGDVVLFSPLNSRGQADRIQLGHVRYVFEENELIDRIVGLPGDQVVWDDGKLSINGTAVSWKPLLPERLPKHLDITVPERPLPDLADDVGGVQPMPRESRRSGSRPA